MGDGSSRLAATRRYPTLRSLAEFARCATARLWWGGGTRQFGSAWTWSCTHSGHPRWISCHRLHLWCCRCRAVSIERYVATAMDDSRCSRFAHECAHPWHRASRPPFCHLLTTSRSGVGQFWANRCGWCCASSHRSPCSRSSRQLCSCR